MQLYNIVCTLTLLSDIGLVYIGLVSLIILGWELHVLYHCTMCTRLPNLVSFAFYAIPIFHILIDIYLLLFLLLKYMASLVKQKKQHHMMGQIYLQKVYLHQQTRPMEQQYVRTLMALTTTFERTCYSATHMICDMM